jgi:hypothetical protein
MPQGPGLDYACFICFILMNEANKPAPVIP